MPTEINNFREKFPQYNDVGDIELAGMLAKKFPDSYSDLPGKVESYQETTEREPERFDFQDPMSVGAISFGKPTREVRPGAETVSRVARTTVPALTATAGAIIGTPGAPGFGTLAGGGVGFAIGEEFVDHLDEFLGLRERKPLMVELKESAKDVAVGAAFEAGGQALIPAVVGAAGVAKFIANKLPKVPLTRTGATKKASEVVAAETTGGPWIAKNMEQAKALEAEIPGLKFSRGQLTNDPAVIKFERAAGRAPGEVAQQQLEQSARNSEAIRKYITVQKGKEGLGEVVTPLTRQAEAVETGVTTARKGLEREAVQLGRGPGVVQTGETIKGAAREGKTAAKKEATRLFEDVPEFDIDATSIVNKIDELSQPLDQFEDVAENVPAFFGKARDILGETGKTTPQGLQGLRRNATQALRKAQSPTEPNEIMASRISKLIGEIDDVLKEAGEIRGPSQARFKGKTIFPEQLKKELSTINKQLQTEVPSEKVIDVEKTFNELNQAKTIGIMRQVQEGTKAYADRLAKSYKIKFGKEAPVQPTFEKVRVKVAKQRKAEVEEILSGATDIKTTEIEAAAGKLKTAQQFYKKEVIQKFKSGAVGDVLKKVRGGDKVSNAQVVSRFFKPGGVGEESAQQFIDAVGKNKTATDAMESAVKQDLLQAATNPTTGELVESKLKGWLSKHDRALTTLGIKDKFNTVLKARAELDTALELKTQFDKSVASKLLNSDVDSAVKNAFASGSKKANAERLLKRMKGDKKAISGLQNSVIDHIITRAETTAVDAFDNPIVSLAGFEREFKKFRPAINEVFKGSPEKLKAFNNYRIALKTLQRGKASPMGGGSDSFELISTHIAKVSGLAHSRVLSMVKALMGPIRDMSDKQVNAILNRAAFDPDFAFTLIRAAKGTPIDIIERRLKGHLLAMGMRSTKKQEKE